MRLLHTADDLPTYRNQLEFITGNIIRAEGRYRGGCIPPHKEAMKTHRPDFGFIDDIVVEAAAGCRELVGQGRPLIDVVAGIRREIDQDHPGVQNILRRRRETAS